MTNTGSKDLSKELETLEPTSEVLQRALLHQQQRPVAFLLQQTPGSSQRREDLRLLCIRKISGK